MFYPEFCRNKLDPMPFDFFRGLDFRVSKARGTRVWNVRSSEFCSPTEQTILSTSDLVFHLFQIIYCAFMARPVKYLLLRHACFFELKRKLKYKRSKRMWCSAYMTCKGAKSLFLKKRTGHWPVDRRADTTPLTTNQNVQYQTNLLNQIEKLDEIGRNWP